MSIEYKAIDSQDDPTIKKINTLQSSGILQHQLTDNIDNQQDENMDIEQKRKVHGPSLIVKDRQGYVQQLSEESFPQIGGILQQLDQKFTEIYGESQNFIDDDDVGYDLQQVYKGIDGDFCKYYSGNWRFGQMHGKGKEIVLAFNDGQIQKYIQYYYGTYKEGVKNGKGYLICQEYVYRGQYKNGFRNGVGELVGQDGSQYIGQYADDRKHGYGYFIDTNDNKYMGYFVADKRQGQGQMIYNDGSKFKGGFDYDYKQGKGKLIDKDQKLVKGFWLFGQILPDISYNESCAKATKRWIIDKVQQFKMWILSNKYIQMVFEIQDFGDHNNYEELSRSDGSSCIYRLFYKIYLVFGMFIRPIFMDLVGPFIPFISYFWLIAGEKDIDCGKVKSFELSIINYSFLSIVNIGQIMMIVSMIVKYSIQFKEQKQHFYQNAKLKGDLAKNEYRKKYKEQEFKSDFDADFQNVDLQQIQDHNQDNSKLSRGVSSNDNQQLGIIKRQSSRRTNGTQKMEQILRKQKTKSTEMYKQLNKINQQHLEHKFNYFKSFNDFKHIGVSISLDLDLLSDSMAVKSCYVLSQSMNLSLEIRQELTFYYQCSMIILLVSLMPKWNCYLFLILTRIVRRIGILKLNYSKDYENHERQYVQQRLIVQKNCFKKLIFHLYRIVARFYGMNYNKSENYIFNSKDTTKDIIRLFYVNHEDLFTADQFNPAKQTVDLLFYDEMEKNTHSSLRMNFFRTFFENIPQLILQVLMIYALQNSNVEDCKKTDFAFYQSIVTTSLSMISGLVIIFTTLFQKILDGDLVAQNMKIQFDQYLKEKKAYNTGDVVEIKDKIELHPKMIESLYEFLLENNKYKKIRFGNEVVFKGEINDYFKVIEFTKQQDSLSESIRVEFDNDKKSKEQIMAELTLKKIFEQLIVIDSNIKWSTENSQNKLIVRYKDEYRFGANIDSLVKLINSGHIELYIDITDAWDKVFQYLAEDQVKKLSKYFKVVINDEIFRIRLFYDLVQMREIIMSLNFIAKSKRIMKMVEKYKVMISKIEGRIGIDCKYIKYFELKDQLDDLKLEIDVVEYGYRFYEFYRNQSEEDQQISRNIFSLQHAVIGLDEDKGSIQNNITMMKQFVSYGVTQIRNDMFRLNQYCDKQYLESIKEVKKSNPQLIIIHELNENREKRQQQQSVDDQKGKLVKFKDFIKLEQIDINQIIMTSVSSDLEYIDQAFEKYVQQDEYLDIFGKLDIVKIQLRQQDLQNIVEIGNKQKQKKSRYQIKVIIFESSISQPSVDDFLDAVKVIYSFYGSLLEIRFQFYMIDQEFRDMLLKLTKCNYPQIEVKEL